MFRPTCIKLSLWHKMCVFKVWESEAPFDRAQQPLSTSLFAEISKDTCVVWSVRECLLSLTHIDDRTVEIILLPLNVATKDRDYLFIFNQTRCLQWFCLVYFFSHTVSPLRFFGVPQVRHISHFENCWPKTTRKSICSLLGLRNKNAKLLWSLF